MTFEIVRLRDGDEERVAPVLARAFADDPLFVWIEPEAEARQRFLAPFMLALAKRSHRFAEAFTTAGELLGASLWKGPSLRQLSAAQLADSGLDRLHELLSPTAFDRFERGTGQIDALLERDAPEPHWYLGVLGVEPTSQGLGLGERLMRPIVERADAERLPITLETTRERNVEFYRRRGFEILVAGRLPDDGPPFWTMKRSALARSSARVE